MTLLDTSAVDAPLAQLRLVRADRASDRVAPPLGPTDVGRLFELAETAATLLADLTDVATALATTGAPRPASVRADGRRDTDVHPSGHPARGADSRTDAAVPSDLLRAWLEGRGRLDVLATRLGRPHGEWFLTCLTDAAPSNTPASDTATSDTAVSNRAASDRAASDRAASKTAAATTLPVAPLAGLAASLRPASIAAVLDGDVYVLAPYLNPDDARLLTERMRARFAERLGRDLVACLCGPFETTSDATSDPQNLRRTVCRGASVLAREGNPTAPRVRTAAQLRPQLVLAELAEFAHDHHTLDGGPLGMLRDHDADRGTEFLRSLLAYFDAGCDVTEAAKRLHVHRNTLRYRLQRIEEVSGTSLSAPLERFTLELQVRLHFVNA